jgi:hypothetical protein
LRLIPEQSRQGVFCRIRDAGIPFPAAPFCGVLPLCGFGYGRGEVRGIPAARGPSGRGQWRIQADPSPAQSFLGPSRCLGQGFIGGSPEVGCSRERAGLPRPFRLLPCQRQLALAVPPAGRGCACARSADGWPRCWRLEESRPVPGSVVHGLCATRRPFSDAYSPTSAPRKCNILLHPMNRALGAPAGATSCRLRRFHHRGVPRGTLGPRWRGGGINPASAAFRAAAAIPRGTSPCCGG